MRFNNKYSVLAFLTLAMCGLSSFASETPATYPNEAAGGASKSLFATTSAPVVSPSNSQGSLKGLADANYSGTFQWSYPINLPVGTNGVQPNLSINYNSAAPNGLMGMGFSLSGLSSIERDPTRGINFTASDHYVLDGQKLFYSSIDASFHGERESFDRIQAFSPSMNGNSPVANPNSFDCYWVISKKDGTRLYYGQSSDSRIAAIGEADTQGRSLPRVWALNKVIDPNGNYYSIEYQQDSGSGAYYPLAIVYTKNDNNPINTWKKIQFSYEMRTDHAVMYQPSKVDLDRRLKWITILYAADALGVNAKLIRKYGLDYQYSSSSNRSQLLSIQEYGNEGNWPGPGLQTAYAVTGNALPKVDFDWPKERAGFSEYTNEYSLFGFYDLHPEPVSDLSYYKNIYSMDVNGDGKTDIVALDAKSGSWRILFSNGHGYDPYYNETNLTGFYALAGVALADLPYYLNIYPMDVNGDGKTDIVTLDAKNGVWRVLFSNGHGFDRYHDESNLNGFYRLGGVSVNELPYYLNIYPMDVNSDGKTDIVTLDAKNGVWRVLFSNGLGFDTPYTEPNLNGFYQLGGVAVNDLPYFRNLYPMDVNGDGKTDIVALDARNGVWRVLFSNGHGFDPYYDETNLNGFYALGGVPCTELHYYLNICPMDVNGDGKMDIVTLDAKNGVWRVLFANGHGFNPYYDETNLNGFYQLGNVPIGEIQYYKNIIPTDVNGDGKSDIVTLDAKNGAWRILLSNGHGFNPYYTESNLNGFYALGGAPIWDLPYYLNLYKADVNGDGKAEIITADMKNGAWRILNPIPSVCDMVVSIKTPTGGSIKVTYLPAAQFASAILPNHSSYPVIANASPRYLVQTITFRNGLPNVPDVSVTYDYKDGLYKTGIAEDHADLGFKTVIKIDNGTGTRTTTTFSQETPTQGFPLNTLIKDKDGTTIAETINAYAVASNPTISQVKFIYPTSTITKRFDGQATSTDTKKTFDSYDAKGNLLQTTNWGIIQSNGSDLTTADNVREVYNYATNDSLYLTRITKKQSFSYDSSGVEGLASETRYYYDGSNSLGSIGIGRGTKVESVITNTPTEITSASTMEYDNWGNVVKTTDPNGIVTNQVVYDSDYHNLVVSQTDAQGLTNTILAWDHLQPSRVQDPYGNVSSTFYDVFGRKIKAVSPLPRDSENSPSAEIIYHDVANLPSTPAYTESREKTGANTWLSTFSYVDGLGRVVQSKSQAKVGGQWVTVDRYYDASGRNSAVSNPYLTNSSAFIYDPLDTIQKRTSFEFDPVGRVTKTIHPDGTSASTIYNQTITSSVDELLHVSQVEDRGSVRYTRSYTGTYLNQQLYTTVTMRSYRGKTQIEDDKDNNPATPGNISTSIFNMVGQKIQSSDPDQGTWYYEYFANGSLKKQTDAKGNVLSFEYDTVGRLSKKFQNGIQVATYTYGNFGNQKGRLETLAWGNNSTTVNYDQFGRSSSVSKTMDGFGTRITTFDYNSDGRVDTKHLPTGENIRYQHSPEGLVVNQAGNNTYLSSITTDDFGRTVSQTLGNATATTYSFDPVTMQTTDIVTPGVMNLHYTFDAIGNVLTRTDGIASSASETYSYDELYRLKHAQGIYGTRDYLYDTIDNLLGQNGTTVNSYDLSQPHALTGNGIYTYSYDANGNMSAKTLGGNQVAGYGYDAENRLIQVSMGGTVTAFTYDDTRQRTTKTDITTTAGTVTSSKTTVFWFDDYEETFDNLVSTITPEDKVTSYFAKGQKIAQYSSAESKLVFLYQDHLGSTSVVANSVGTVVSRLQYEAYGKLASSDDGKVRQMFTGQEWDANTGLAYYNARYYDPELGRFTQADPAVMDLQYQVKLSLAERMNPFMYCGNNPVVFTDPTGQYGIIESLVTAVVACVVVAVLSAIVDALNQNRDHPGTYDPQQGLNAAAAATQMAVQITSGTSIISPGPTSVGALAYPGTMTTNTTSTYSGGGASVSAEYPVGGGTPRPSARGRGSSNRSQRLPEEEAYERIFEEAARVQRTGGEVEWWRTELPWYRGAKPNINPLRLSSSDISRDSNGMVYPRSGGLSISLNPNSYWLKPQGRPGAPFNTQKFPEGLTIRPQPNGKDPYHALIEPIRPMTYKQFQNLLYQIPLGQ